MAMSKSQGAQGGKPRGGAGQSQQGQGGAHAAHDAAEYENAVNAVADVLEEVIKYIPSTGKAGTARKAVETAVPSLRKAAHSIAALAPAFDVAMEQMPGVAKTVGDAASAAGTAVAEAAGNAAHAVTDPVNAAIAERQADRARREARKSIIEHAGTRMPLAKFPENYDTHAKLFNGSASDAPFPGCYVIIRVGKGVMHDAADFKDVYVGASNDMWEAVASELAGNGNPDVYADAKYDAGVEILMYPCAVDQTATLRDALIVALDADVSYNARELGQLARVEG